MRRAIDLALERMGETWPNPAVGCVIVKDGRIVGQAATAPGGRPHAEEQALEAAGERARGARAYVTLEPCGERSGGTRSCAERLAAAGVGEVFVAARDASPFASGRGLARLAEAGVPVTLGLLETEAAALYADYVPPRRT